MACHYQNSTGRTKIKQWFKKEEKEENIIRGREMILADIGKDISRRIYAAPDQERNRSGEMAISRHGMLLAHLSLPQRHERGGAGC